MISTKMAMRPEGDDKKHSQNDDRYDDKFTPAFTAQQHEPLGELEGEAGFPRESLLKIGERIVAGEGLVAC